MKATVASDTSFLRVRQLPASGANVIGHLKNGELIDIVDVMAGGTLSKPWARLRLTIGQTRLFSDEALSSEQFAYVLASLLQIEYPAPVGIRVPWWSQVGNEYANDCGPACWAMLLSYAGVTTPFSVSSLVRRMNVRGKYTDADHADACLRAFSLTPTRGGVAKLPRMALVSYPKLVDRYDPNYRDLHWVVQVGETDERVSYHDPLWPTAAKGAYKTIPLSGWQAAEAGHVTSRVGVLI